MAKLGQMSAKSVALLLTSAIPSNCPATTYIEYKVDGVGPGRIRQQASPTDSPYEIDYKSVFVGITTRVMYNYPNFGTGYIGISSFDFGYAEAIGSHLLINIQQDEGHGSITWSGIDVCFDHDLGGQLPTSSFGFIPDCGSISLYLGSYYKSQFADGRSVRWFSAHVLEGPSYPTAPAFLETRFTPNVPEPSTWVLMMLGFGAIGMALRSRSNRESQMAILDPAR